MAEMNIRKLNKLKSKAYRHAYVAAHLTQGIAYQIRALRESRGWDQKELALKIGLKSQSAIARLEDPSYGKFSIATIRRLSEAFDVALIVKFAPYSRLLTEVENISSESLAVPSFTQELPSLERSISVFENLGIYKSATYSKSENTVSTPIYNGASVMSSISLPSSMITIS